MNTSNPDAFRRAKRLGPAALLALLLVVAWDPAAPGSAGGIADAAPPSPPATITVHRGSNFLDVAWSAVDGATGYDVAYSANDGWSWTRAATGVTGTKYRITGVPNAGGHIVGMRVTTAGGTSDWKNSATNYAALEPYPAGDVEVTRAAGELLVSWTQCDVSLS